MAFGELKMAIAWGDLMQPLGAVLCQKKAAARHCWSGAAVFGKKMAATHHELEAGAGGGGGGSARGRGRG